MVLDHVPTRFMVFPYSNRPALRRLVLRNPYRHPLAVKIVSTCPKPVLRFEERTLRIQPDEWDSTQMVLDVGRLADPDELPFHSVNIYCRRADLLGEDGVKKWFACNKQDQARHLAHSLKLQRVKGFAAPDTVVDLPARSSLLEVPDEPQLGGRADDPGCRTAHAADSGTQTAPQLSQTDLLACFPDSLAVTALPMDQDTRTARQIGVQGLYVADLLDSVFPGSGRMVSNNTGITFACGQN